MEPRFVLNSSDLIDEEFGESFAFKYDEPLFVHLAHLMLDIPYDQIAYPDATITEAALYGRPRLIAWFKRNPRLAESQYTVEGLRMSGVSASVSQFFPELAGSSSILP